MESFYFIVALLMMVAGSHCVMTYDILDYRLITQDRPNVGIVEVLTAEEGWGLICDSHWNFELASEVCENLTFPGTSRFLNAGNLVAEGDAWLTSVTNNTSIYYHSCTIHEMDMRCNPHPAKHICDIQRIAAVTCKEPRYLGCFKDPSNGLIDPFRDRALSNGPESPNKLTIEKCVNACKSEGFFYSGVEYQVMCFCGAQDEDYSRHGNVSDKDCYYPGYPCPGDHLESCGAPDRIAVYLAGRDFCDVPGSLANGFMSVDSLQYGIGSNVYFNCSEGFLLDGPEVIQCVETYGRGAIVTRESISSQHAVIWNNTLPKCTGIGSTASTTVTTHAGAETISKTFIGTLDPSKREGVSAMISTIVILITLIVIAVLVFIVWRRQKKSAANQRSKHQANDDNYTSLNVISSSACGRGSGDGRGCPGDGQAATSVYQALNEPAHGIRTGLNVDGYYEDTNVDNEYYEISADRAPEEQGSRNQMGQDGDERKASPGIHPYGNQKVINQREQRSARAPISSRKAEPEYLKPI